MQPIPRPIETGGGAERIDDHLAFVEDWNLDENMRQIRVRKLDRRQRHAPERSARELCDIDGDEKKKTAADEDEAQNGERQDDVEDEAHELNDNQRCIPSEPILCRRSFRQSGQAITPSR